MKTAMIEAGPATALKSRDAIGQAKGVVDGGDGFEVLKHLSQHHNRKLVSLAEEIARTGEIPAATK